MTEEDLQQFRTWFDDYTKSFYSSVEEDQRNIMLKIEHTKNVCMNIAEIAKGASLDDNPARMAGAIALFHDIGRFPQYAKYRTFRDAISTNHGLLGAKTLIDNKVLERVPEDEKQLILQTVRFHNAFAIPAAFNGDSVLFLKLIRDADKVDIFRIFIEYYKSPEDERASATAFGVPDTPEYSGAMLSCVLNRKVASYSNIKTENDFRLMKLSWIYDMHFNESIRLLQQRDYVNHIINMLPDTDEIRAAVSTLRAYMTERLGNA